MVRAGAGISQLERSTAASFQTRGLRLGPLGPRGGDRGSQEGRGSGSGLQKGN